MIGEDYNLSDFKEQVKKGAEIYGIQIDSTPRRSRAEEDFRPMDGQNRAKTGQNTDTHYPYKQRELCGTQYGR